MLRPGRGGQRGETTPPTSGTSYYSANSPTYNSGGGGVGGYQPPQPPVYNAGGYAYQQPAYAPPPPQPAYDSYNSGPSVGYGGLGDDSYKDKPRHRSSSAVPAMLTQPWLWVALACLVLAALAFSARSQKGLLLDKLGTKSIDEAIKQWQSLQTENKDLQRQIIKLKHLEKQAKTAAEQFEREKKKLQTERDRLLTESTKLSSTKDSEEVLANLEKRERGYKKMVEQLQLATQRESKRVVLERWGPGPHRVRMTIILPSDLQTEHHFVIEMAPLDYMPHAVHVFLEQVAHGLWNNAWFYVNGPHVMQCGPQADETELQRLTAEGKKAEERTLALKPFRDLRLDNLAFPEYHDAFPHEQWTLGFTGRPCGPDWYLNKRNNTIGHGPGGQKNHELAEYADPCFAKVVDGFDALEKAFREPTVMSGEFRYFYEEPIHLVRAVVLVSKEEAQQAGAGSAEQEAQGQAAETTRRVETPGDQSLENAQSAQAIDAVQSPDQPLEQVDGAAQQQRPPPENHPAESTPEAQAAAEGDHEVSNLGEAQADGAQLKKRKPLMMPMIDHQVEY